MREQSAVDPVTGLLSASAFRERVQSELINPDDHEVSCVLLDIDYLDQLNQWHGCTVGDEVLRAVANQIRGMAGECKYLAVWVRVAWRRCYPTRRMPKRSPGRKRCVRRSPIWKSP